MSLSMLNITHNQSWVIYHRDIYSEVPRFSSFGTINASLEESQIYILCKRNKINFSPFVLPIPVDSLGLMRLSLVEQKQHQTVKHKCTIDLTDYLHRYQLKNTSVKCYTPYPFNTLVIKDSYDNQMDSSAQSFVHRMNDIDTNIFDLEVCYVGQSNRDSKNIFERLKKHEAILKLHADIATHEPHKEILIVLLNIKKTPSATFMLGGFGDNNAGYELNQNDLDNLETRDVPFNDLVNCAEAILINSFKPSLNTVFKNNLLGNNLKTVKYFRDRGYGGISFELDLFGGKQRIFSSVKNPEEFFMLDYDLRSERNNTKFLKLF